jgi:hypothetical protein
MLHPPYKRDHIPDDEIREKISVHFAEILGEKTDVILGLLPEKIPSFGKLRIVDGDSIRSASACGDGSTAERNMSLVRVSSPFYTCKAK